TSRRWGRIWDAVPADFPRSHGATDVPVDRPASLAYEVAGGAATVATELEAAVELARYSTAGASGLLEDGSRSIDSVGDPLDCRVQTTISPRGSTTHVTVMYGV